MRSCEPMIVFALLLGVASFALGMAFSATETAFYRVSKLRLKLDALDGNIVAKWFLWLTNNPGFFIATLLVGTNVTTYGTSMAAVLFIGHVFPSAAGFYLELAATLILAPILFVWGEMFPKNLSLNIPYRMLRLCSPVIAVSCWLFLPLTAILWGFDKILATILTQSGNTTTLTLGRRDLSSILVEG